MAKKIRLDFSKVEERSGWKTNNMPEGIHEMKIELVDYKDANDGTAMLTYGLRPTNPKYKTRLFPYYCKQQQNQLFKIRDLYIAAGIDVPKKVVNLDPEAPIGKIIAAEVRDGTGQFSERSEIDGVYSRDILEDDEAEDSEEDDEVEDEELEEDELEEDEEFEEDDEDEEEEDLSSLTLGELRKRAKGLGIDTDGVKKAELIELILEEEADSDSDDEDEEDEEDDLGDEDLEDEEFEDEEFDEDEDEEEEEEAPAPRRRASSAKKAPAKPAPAKRRVTRR